MAQHSLDGCIGVDLDATGTSQVFALGFRQCASDNAIYEYVRADEALAQYAAVKVDDDYECSELTTAISGAEPTRVAVPQVAFADTEYGYAVVCGSGSVLAAASCAADVKLYTTTTAGVLDDTATDLVQGVKLTATNGGSQAAVAFFAAQEMVTNAQD